MTYRIVCSVYNNQVVVILPPDFSDKKQLLFFVNDQVDNKTQKTELLRMA